MNFKKIPKVELHRHLDGSVRFETIYDLVQKNNLSNKNLSKDELFKKVVLNGPMSSLNEVLDSFWGTQEVLCHYDAIKRVTFENYEDCVSDGVVLSELRCAPTFIKMNKSLEHDEIIEGILDGLQMGMDKYPDTKVGLIYILPRRLDLDCAETGLDLFIKHRNNHSIGEFLVGFDLADEEKEDDIDKFVPYVEKAKKAGLGITVHSGEGTSPNVTLDAISKYSPQRIGHALNLLEDDRLLKEVQEREIHLELCPTSNYLTKCISKIDDHPLKKYMELNLSISINSDDPHLMNYNLIEEYKRVTNSFNLSRDDWGKINQSALSASFLGQKIKNRIVIN